jgi:glycosyltransferase involved in cell wall biosynthesis
LNPAVTIVLPVHNVERSLRAAVLRVLDLAEIMGRRVRVAVVDDGSTDGTYETAAELAREFPQVVALREPFQRGLGAALEQVRQRLGAEHVVVHDGITPIDLDDLAEMLSSSPAAALVNAPFWEAALEGRGSRRLAAPAMLSTSGGQPLRAGGSFRWLRLDEPLAPRRRRSGVIAPVEVRRDPLAGHANTFA